VNFKDYTQKRHTNFLVNTNSKDNLVNKCLSFSNLRTVFHIYEKSITNSNAEKGSVLEELVVILRLGMLFSSAFHCLLFFCVFSNEWIARLIVVCYYIQLLPTGLALRHINSIG